MYICMYVYKYNTSLNNYHSQNKITYAFIYMHIHSYTCIIHAYMGACMCCFDIYAPCMHSYTVSSLFRTVGLIQ